jgi:hypothetical protein
MTALGIEFSSRDADLFYWPAPSTHGKSTEYMAVSDRIEELWARYIRLCDVEPLPQFKLDEIQDEINRLEKEKEYLFKRDQMAISNMRKEMVTA